MTEKEYLKKEIDELDRKIFLLEEEIRIDRAEAKVKDSDVMSTAPFIYKILQLNSMGWYSQALTLRLKYLTHEE